jgi:phosphoglycolate phosphatase-like HAD superfamily hydrolase
MNYKTKLLFLDVDGVILDSLEVGYKGTAEVFVSEGITPPTQEKYHRDFDGHSAIGFYRSRGVKISSEEIWKRFLAYYDSHDHLVFQEVPEVLRSLSNSGVRLYFVTFGRSEDRVGTMFKKYGSVIFSKMVVSDMKERMSTSIKSSVTSISKQCMLR